MKRTLKPMNTEQNIIGTGFEQGFSLRMTDGKLRRFGSCDWRHDDSFEVVAVDGKFFLVHEDSRDNGFAELGREELPAETLATWGFHDDEHGDWATLSAMLETQTQLKNIMKDKTQIKLVCNTIHPSRGMGNYGHIRLHVRVELWDEATQRFHWSSGLESVNGLYVKNLEIGNQCDDNQHDTVSYGWNVEYRNCYSVDLNKAKQMAATLTVLDQRIQKLRDELGYPTTYGQYVARVASAMKITAIVFNRERDGVRQGEFELSPGGAQSHIDRDCIALANECRAMAGKDLIA